MKIHYVVLILLIVDAAPKMFLCTSRQKFNKHQRQDYPWGVSHLMIFFSY